MSADRFSLDGRSALVTGGARGIGRAIAEGLLASGAQVTIADSDSDALQQTSDSLGCDAEVLDVTDATACAGLGARLTVDIVVANAGIVHNAPFAEYAPADWQRVIDVNLTGVFNTLHGFSGGLLQRGRGSVVCVSSICGVVPVWPQPQVAYNAAKAGVNLMVKSAAVEWAKYGIRVNAVAPGYTATDLTLAGRSRPDWFEVWMDRTPMGRLGKPYEIADAVRFLACDAASFVTGTVLTVDGGYTAL